MAVITPGLPDAQLCHDLRAATLKACADAGLPAAVAAAIERSTNRPAPGALFFGAAENIAGPDRPYVLVTGFQHLSYVRVRRAANMLSKRVDPAAYVAMTRCTFQLSIVEADAAVFGAHLRISASGDTGVTEVEATPGAGGSQMAMSGRVDWSATVDGVAPNQRSVVTRATTAEVLYLSGKLLSEVPRDAWQLHGLKELHLSCNQLTSLPTEVGQLVRLERLDLRGKPADLVAGRARAACWSQALGSQAQPADVVAGRARAARRP